MDSTLTLNWKFPSSKPTDALLQALGPNLVMRFTVILESNQESETNDKHRVGVAASLSVAQSWPWGNQVTGKKMSVRKYYY